MQWMKRVAVVIALLAMPVLAEVSTTRPADTGSLAEPATQPATRPALKSPAELFRELKAQRDARASLLKVALFDLREPIMETQPEFSWFSDDTGTLLQSLLARIEMAKDDSTIKAVLVNIAQPGFTLAQAQEIRDALAALHKSGKRVFVYADGYDTVAYTLASGASDICMLEGGDVMIPGVGFEAQFLKGLFDKVGVKADFVQIGQYKGADEAYTRTEPSQELREEMNRLSDALFDQIVSGISLHRNLSRQQVKAIVDETMLSGKKAKERGLVDHLVDQDGLRDLIAGEIGGKIDLIRNYGQAEREEIDTTNIFALFAAMAKKPPVSDKPAIALIPAQGVIVDGEGEASLFGDGGVGSEKMRRALRIAGRDPKIKAVVIRIDSPGGSALASEVMWQAVRRVAKDKPVIISIGSMAASGGYYLACAGETIYADPTAIVGSIGVVGGKFVLKDLFAKVGITSEAFMRGKNAGLFSSSEPWTQEQRKLITAWMTNTYEQFTSRVMETRKGKIKDIDQVARGRIFLAPQARDLGMVDEIGGLEKALAHAADRAKLKKGTYDIRYLPEPRTLGDLLMGRDPEARTPIRPGVTIAPDSVLHLLPPRVRKAMLQQLHLAHLMSDRPGVLALPFGITMK